MQHCDTCKSMPWRALFELQEDANKTTYPVKLFKRPEFPDDYSEEPFVKWHSRLSELQANAAHCPTCSMVMGHLKDSWHYKNIKEDVDKALWLLRGGSVFNLYFQMYMGDDEKLECRVSGKFNLSTTKDDPLAKFFKDHVVIPDQMHPLVLKQMSSWLHTCDQDHPNCPHKLKQDAPLPTRLLDLGSLPEKEELVSATVDPRSLLNGGALKLLETGDGAKGRYMALSYCWGKSLAYTTTTKNLAKHTSEGGIKYDALPKTLQDAIFIVRFLGLQYIWIDCVCIVQDDKADWEHEAGLMASVYSNAYLTIAATRASSCAEGFLQNRILTDGSVLVDFFDESGDFRLWVTYDDLTKFPGSMDAVVNADMRMRQATRTLHFAAEQMNWECPTDFFNEDDTAQSSAEHSIATVASQLKSSTNLLSTNPERADVDRRPWYILLEGYTSRDITYLSDKLPALSGVLDALQQETGDKCYAGIWKSWFLPGLMWRLQVPEHDLYVFTPKQPLRPDAWRAPSWSFAALEGIVLYSLLENDHTGVPIAQLQEVSVTPKGRNPLGELAAGYAKITAPVVPLVNIGKEVTLRGRACTVLMKDDQLAAGSVYFDVEPYELCDVIMITPHTGIAIVPHHGKGNDEYMRVGAVSVYRKWADAAMPRENAWEGMDRSLCEADYMEARSITLL